MDELLKVQNLNVSYGGIHALRDVSINVNEGEIVSIIGANGAGKSSLMNAISGVIKYTGDIHFERKAVPKQAYKVVQAGICHVPEGRRIFANLTTLENLRLGAYRRSRADNLDAEYKRVFELFPRLKEREKQVAGTLSGGEQQMLAIGRGLMSNPKLLMLDEPSLGLAPLLVETIFDIIKEIKAMGKTILLVEQNAYKALEVSDRAYAIEQGCITISGTGRELMNDPKVQEVYLGKKK